MLYLVSTPIGNLEEMSPRAIRVLSQSPLVLVEKRSDCLKLLHHFGIRSKEVIQYDDASHKRIISTILKKLETIDAAYITSAGTPGVSDPGNRLVQAVRAAGIPISVVSGPSALTAAIAASGLPSPYLFVGFLEKKHSALQTALRNAASVKATLVFYESTHRIIKTLSALKHLLPNEQIFVSKELTKLHETLLYGTPIEILDIFAKNSALTRGEFVVMVPPAR